MSEIAKTIRIFFREGKMVYHIPPVPLLQAIAIGDIKESGRTHPTALKCSPIGQTGLTEYIVKFYASMDYGKHSLARELLGSLLASFFGLITPDPAIIEIPGDLHIQETDPEIAKMLRASPGYNFGSRTIEAGIFTPITSLREELIPEAVMIFCFDSLILNPDRRIDKTNMFETREGYIVFDHEMAFPFSHPEGLIGGLPDPWQLNTSNSQSIRNHYFFGKLKKIDIDLEPFVKRLEELSDSVLSEMVERLPSPWRDNHIQNIIHYLSRARDNAGKMRTGLQEVLV